MPLPAPDCARQASHQRTIQVSSFRRSDGLWDIEGHLSDVWPEPVPRSGGVLPAGQAMHSMWLRLTLDRSATIVAVQAVTDAGPYDQACSAINPAYLQLVGVQVARGWREAVRRLLGRTAGCTHLNELATVMGSAVQQAMWTDLQAPSDVRPFSIDGCHALRSDGPQVAEFFPQWYRPESPSESPPETRAAQPSE